MFKILIADDEEKIRDMIAKYATHEGYQVFLASNGKQALEIFKKEDIDVVILDIMMPEMDGYEALKKMREIKETHCIFLTALGEEYDRVYGFDIGAEDYVTKPFSLKELMMRIRVIINRKGDNKERIITVNQLSIDTEARIVRIRDNKIVLANKEYELLLLLINNKGKAVSREMIISDIWGYEYDSEYRTLDTHIKLLRKKLGEYGKYIVTLRGVGYRFEEEI